jgi:hypothetical protein
MLVDYTAFLPSCIGRRLVTTVAWVDHLKFCVGAPLQSLDEQNCVRQPLKDSCMFVHNTCTSYTVVSLKGAPSIDFPPKKQEFGCVELCLLSTDKTHFVIVSPTPGVTRAIFLRTSVQVDIRGIPRKRLMFRFPVY